MSTAEGRNRQRFPPSTIGWTFWLRLALVGLVDALVVVAVPILVANESWLLLTLLGVATAILNWAYLSPRATAFKWLAPGLVLLSLFVVFPVIYTAYVSLTNWATGHVLTKNQVIMQLEHETIATQGEGVTLELAIYRNPAGQLAFLAKDPEENAFFGLARLRTDEPIADPLLDPASLGADVSGDPPEAIGDFQRMSLRDLFAIADQIEELVLDVPGQGVIQAQTTSQARLLQAGQRYRYDPETDTVLDTQTNVTCVAQEGNFICADGRSIDPGWRVTTGFDNYNSILSNQRIRGPLIKVFIWNMIFALGSVALTFIVGLVLANALSDDRIKGRGIYRSIYILPYAIPGFLSVLVWRGLLNQSFGQVNGILNGLGIGDIPWLGDPFWAKVAILLVNIWLGFPYMFLITSGALTAIPNELKEAARVDGASAWRVFRTITLPLLLVSTAPLLIGSFAFNFNNFVLIFLLTNGGPPVVNTDVPLGETDILISFTYDLAVNSGRGNQFALGSAIVILIFLMVAIMAAASFRLTKRLEEVYGNV